MYLYSRATAYTVLTCVFTMCIGGYASAYPPIYKQINGSRC